MLRGHHAVLKVAMAKKVGVPIRVVAPGRRRVAVEALVSASKDALSATVTSGPAVGTGASREGGAVATEDERLEGAQSAALDRGEHGAVKEGAQRGVGVGWAGLAGLGGMPLGLFLLEMAPMTPLAQAAGADVVGTRRRIGTVFEAVNKGVEGPDRGRLEGGKASDLRQARMGAQVIGPLRETFVVQQQHEEEGPQHTHGVAGGPATGARRIECPQHGGRGVG